MARASKILTDLHVPFVINQNRCSIPDNIGAVRNTAFTQEELDEIDRLSISGS